MSEIYYWDRLETAYADSIVAENTAKAAAPKDRAPD